MFFAVTHHKWGIISNTTLAPIYAATLPINDCSRVNYIFNVYDWLFICLCYPADHCLLQRACDSSHNNWMAWSLRYDFSTSVSHSRIQTHRHISLSYSVRLLTITHRHWCALSTGVCCIYSWQECTRSIFKFASCSQWPQALWKHPTDAPNQLLNLVWFCTVTSKCLKIFGMWDTVITAPCGGEMQLLHCWLNKSPMHPVSFLRLYKGSAY